MSDKTTDRERITLDELHERLRQQAEAAGHREHDHLAFVCPACGTVQSAALLTRHGCPRPQEAVGFSCVGRSSGSGKSGLGGGSEEPHLPRGERPGCDWTLGGLFRIHRLEVVETGGRVYPLFEVAPSDLARALRLFLTGDKRAEAPGEKAPGEKAPGEKAPGDGR